MKLKNLTKQLLESEREFLDTKELIEERINIFKKENLHNKYDFDTLYDSKCQRKMKKLIKIWLNLFANNDNFKNDRIEFSMLNNSYLFRANNDKCDIEKFLQYNYSCDMFKNIYYKRITYNKSFKNAILDYLSNDNQRKSSFQSLVSKGSYYGSCDDLFDYFDKIEDEYDINRFIQDSNISIEEIEIGYLTDSDDKIFIVYGK